MRISGEAVGAILTHARNCEPEECCGLIATDDGEIVFVYPLTNVDRSPRSFTSAPDEALGAFLHAERSGWAIGGVFHSHPSGPEIPSKRDITEAADERWLHLLVSPSGLKCFKIADGVVHEIELVD